MKRLIILIALLATGCGQMQVSQEQQPAVGSPPITVDQPQESPFLQPFVFEEVGGYINGSMPIDLAELPSGNWLVATRDGNVILLDSFFFELGHSNIPVTTYWDSGLVSMVVDHDFDSNRRVFFYLTFPDGQCPDAEVYCNGVLSFTVDEEAEDPLTNPEIIHLIPMVNRDGIHQGGGMVMAEDGYLYVAVGDGQIYDTMKEILAADLSQIDGHDQGKILKINPNSPNEVEQIAKGLRNPFTMTLVPSLGLLIGDVGWEEFDELNLYQFDDRGSNFGWPLEEGPKVGSAFTQPIVAFSHCDTKNQDQDPFGHDGDHKGMTVKRHAGVVHECGSEIIASVGYYKGEGEDPYLDQLDRTAIYSAAYYGYVRGVTLDDDGETSVDRHLTHFPGLVSTAVGRDGYLYGVSIFGSNHVLRMKINTESHAETN